MYSIKPEAKTCWSALSTTVIVFVLGTFQVTLRLLQISENSDNVEPEKKVTLDFLFQKDS